MRCLLRSAHVPRPPCSSSRGAPPRPAVTSMRRPTVIPDTFEYYAPWSMIEAVGLLQRYSGEAKVLAGGQSLSPLMKFRLANPGYLVDLRKVPGLTRLEERDGALVIGAMVRESAIEASHVIR